MEEEVKRELLRQIARPELTREELVRLVIALLPFGRIKGRIGKWVVRWHKDKPIISRLPDIFHPSQTQSSVKNREHMAAVVKFAKCLNQIPPIKEIWSKADLKGNSAFNRLISYNKKQFTDKIPSYRNIIAPPGGRLDLLNLSVSKEDKTFIINQNTPFRCGDILTAILIPYEPVDKNNTDFQVIKLYESSPATQLRIVLTEEQIRLCAQYKKYFVYVVLIRKSGRGISWSDTFSYGGIFSHIELSEKEGVIIYYFIPVYFIPVKSTYRAAEGKKAHSPPGMLRAA